MNLTRIKTAIDVQKTRKAKVAVIGAGGSAGKIQNLARCGVQDFRLFDPDRVSASNVARQEHPADRVGEAKVDVVADLIRRINPRATVQTFACRFNTLSDADIDRHVGDCDLLIFATDSFAAQAHGNEVALRLGKPALWVGLYAQGLAGEVIFWHPGIDACFRCLCAKRYAAHERAAASGESLDPSSDGCTIFDVTLLDSIAGMLAIGLLTRGSDNRFGRLIDELGDRNFLQVQLSPDWTIGGKQVVREQLGIDPDCPAFFAWNTIVRSDPAGGNLPCPDCEKFRGHGFLPIHGTPIRVKAETAPGVSMCRR